MLAKKSEKASVGAYSKIFFQLGLLLSLIIIYTAIEWRTFDRSVDELSALNIQEEEIIDIPITERIMEVKPPTRFVIMVLAHFKTLGAHLFFDVFQVFDDDANVV